MQLLERLLIECFIHAPAAPLDFLLAGLEKAAAGEEVRSLRESRAESREEEEEEERGGERRREEERRGERRREEEGGERTRRWPVR